ncbi:MAG: domain containing protein [Schlesneria sp.]|nr:domain containing protein [Schlesneria sp.]
MAIPEGSGKDQSALPFMKTELLRGVPLSSRKPAYLIGLFLLALVLSAPQSVTCFQVVEDCYRWRRGPQLPAFENWSRCIDRSLLGYYATEWHGQYIELTPSLWTNGTARHRITGFDPRTRQTMPIGERFSSNSDLQPVTFGDRLWLVGTGEAYEFVDGAPQPATLVQPVPWPEVGERFLLDGNPAVFQRTRTGIHVKTYDDGVWITSHELVLPDPRNWSNPNGSADVHYFMVNRCINRAGRMHLFLNVDGSLIYRGGLELKPLGDAPAFAVKTPWTRVCVPPKESHELEYYWFSGMLLDDQPIALTVEMYRDGRSAGNFYRFDGAQWTPFATESFPFGSTGFQAVDSYNGKPALVVVNSSMRSYVYEVDASGVRLIPWKHSMGFTSLNLCPMLTDYGTAWAVTSTLGALLGVGVWLLMRRYTRPGHAFGTQTVTLASLGRRGAAKLIDIGLFALSTIGLGWILLRNLDWIELAEAVNHGADHPMKQLAVRTIGILTLWLVTCSLTLLFVQGRWGVTPGKWCCGLRTVQSTLKPCGFARSLVREVVLWVDACGFLCWTPGVISIALTNQRQRLGDLVADTLVVEVSSIKR